MPGPYAEGDGRLQHAQVYTQLALLLALLQLALLQGCKRLQCVLHSHTCSGNDERDQCLDHMLTEMDSFNTHTHQGTQPNCSKQQPPTDWCSTCRQRRAGPVPEPDADGGGRPRHTSA